MGKLVVRIPSSQFKRGRGSGEIAKTIAVKGRLELVVTIIICNAI